MPNYFLSNWAHICPTKDGAVVLDLHRDEYLALSQNQVAALRGVVFGWPPNSDTRAARSCQLADDSSTVDLLAAALLKRGILTTDPATGKPATPVEIAPAETSALADLKQLPPHKPLEYAACVARACALAYASLRFRSLEKAIAKLERRKHFLALQPASSTGHELQELLNAFMSLRLFFYAPKGNCLFDSLALLNFLSIYRVFPTLVFGVRTNPFEAHAWVQEGRCALNCPAEYTRGFEPIIAV